MDDSAIWLFDEVFLLWCLGVIMVVWIWVMRRRRRGWKDLHFLTVFVHVVGWVLDMVVVVRLLLLVVVCERELGLHLFPNRFWWLNCPTQIIGLTSLL
jgi:hypothetical protein